MNETRKKKAVRQDRAASGRDSGTGPSVPTTERIAQRAYEIFLGRGAEPGREQEDWLQAEKELRERARR